MKTYLIGIDIGTSGCKIAVFNKAGEVLAAQSGTYPVYYPKPGWAEQNPEDWWNTICQVLPEMLQKAEISPDEIAGIGIDGQSWSAIAVDENGNVLTNTPIWMDTRAQDICDELNERIGKIGFSSCVETPCSHRIQRLRLSGIREIFRKYMQNSKDLTVKQLYCI